MITIRVWGGNSLTVGTSDSRVGEVLFAEGLTNNSGSASINASENISFDQTLNISGGKTTVDTLKNISITSNDTYTASTGDDSGALYTNGDGFDVSLNAAGKISIIQNGSSYAVNMQGGDSAGTVLAEAGGLLDIQGHVSATANQRETSTLTLVGHSGVKINTGDENHQLINASLRVGEKAKIVVKDSQSLSIVGNEEFGVLVGRTNNDNTGSADSQGAGWAEISVTDQFNIVSNYEDSIGIAIYSMGSSADISASNIGITAGKLAIDLSAVDNGNQDAHLIVRATNGNIVLEAASGVFVNTHTDNNNPWDLDLKAEGSSDRTGIISISATGSSGYALMNQNDAASRLEARVIQLTSSGKGLVHHGFSYADKQNDNHAVSSLNADQISISAKNEAILTESDEDITNSLNEISLSANSLLSLSSTESSVIGVEDVIADSKTTVSLSSQGTMVLSSKSTSSSVISVKGFDYGNSETTDSQGTTVSLRAKQIVLQSADLNSTAIDASGSKTKVSVVAEGGTEQSVVQGNVYAHGGAQVDISLADGIFEGATNNQEPQEAEGTINISLGTTTNARSGSSARWNVTQNSNLNTLVLNDAVLNLGWRDAQDLNGYKSLKSEYFGAAQGETGGSGDLHFNIDLAQESSGSLDFIDAGRVSGVYTGHVQFDNPQDLADKLYTEHYLIRQEEGSMTVSDPDGKPMSGAGMLSQWTWKFLPDSQKDPTGEITQDDLLGLGNVSNGEAGDWILARVPSEPTDPDVPEIEDNLTLGTSTAQALAYLADLEDLRKRIGEVRYGAQAGVWAKAFSKQDRVESSVGRGFKQEAYGINVGVDALVGKTESSAWLLGGAFRYSRADQEGLAAGGNATGDLNEYSIKAYATWMHERGSYADLVLQAGRYEQELHGMDNTGLGKSEADYDTWGFGASVEIGHMFSLSNGADDRRWFNHWFIEPQLELSYFYSKGQDYHTSTGLSVDQDDADFLTGRAGLVIGKKFNYGTPDDLDRRFFQIAVIGGVKHEFLGGDQTIRYTGVDGVRISARADDIAGTRFYYGLNADWQVGQNWRVFAQFDREEGDGYTKDYDVSLGLKYSF